MPQINARDIATLERAVTNQLSKYSQNSQAIFDKLPPIPLTSLNLSLPVFEGMQGYAPDSNEGIGGDKSQTLIQPAKYIPAVTFYTDKTYTIPMSTKRAMSVLDDAEGTELVNMIAKGTAESKFITMDYNIHNAIASQKYNSGTNIFNVGNIHAETAGAGFRVAMNNAIDYLHSVLNGFSDSRKIIVAIPQKAWYQLTASQKLTNFFNGYASKDATFNVQTINSIFSENAGIEVDVNVAGLRFLESKYETGKSKLIWGEELEFYVFASTSSLYTDRASIKRIEGIEKLNVEQRGNTTYIDFYCDYGYVIDTEDAFVKVKFSVA